MSAKDENMNKRWRYNRAWPTPQDAAQINKRYGCIKVRLQTDPRKKKKKRTDLYIHPDRKLKMVAMDAKRMFVLEEGIDKIKLFKGSNELDQNKLPGAQGDGKNIVDGDTIVLRVHELLDMPGEKPKWECCCRHRCDEKFFNGHGDCRVEKSGACKLMLGEHACAKTLKDKIKAGDQKGCPAAGKGDEYVS